MMFVENGHARESESNRLSIAEGTDSTSLIFGGMINYCLLSSSSVYIGRKKSLSKRKE